MSTITLRNIRKSYGAAEVIKGVDIDIASGEFAVFVGPSGCGKSTLLRMIAGLEGITSGEFLMDGRRMNDVPPDQRGIAMVFQSYALYPHMTVAQNIGFSLDLKGVPKDTIRAEVGDVAEKLQISALLDRKPQDLSGGQRQRVAIGRAIIKKPAVILFDEPLSNLDAALRVQMRAELQILHQNTQSTIVYVTHDQVEAMTLADRIVVLHGGQVSQVAPPITLYRDPANTFVAQFIGSPRMNLLAGRVAQVATETVTLSTDAGHSFVVPTRPGLTAGMPVQIGLRPEALHLVAEGQEATITASVIVAERLGMETYISVDLGGPVPMVARVAGDHALLPRSTVGLYLNPADLYLFDAEGLPFAPAQQTE